MGKKPPKQLPSIKKTVDETAVLGRARKGVKLREEVWQTDGEVVRYNLAYINPLICAVDNGRVLGYDNSHGYHHRHFMGKVKPIEFDSYKALSERFHAEVNELRKEEERNSDKDRKG